MTAGRSHWMFGVGCWLLVVPNSSPQLESALKNHFRDRDGEKNRAHQGIKSEEGDVDPIQAAASRDPMLEHEAADDDGPADEIRDAEAAEQSEGEEEAAHHHVGQKSGVQRVFRTPSEDQRVGAV